MPLEGKGACTCGSPGLPGLKPVPEGWTSLGALWGIHIRKMSLYKDTIFVLGTVEVIKR